MSKQIQYTVASALPHDVNRDAVISILHNHELLVKFNPLVTAVHRLDTAPSFAPREQAGFAWYQVSEKVSILPWGLWNSAITIHVGFVDLPDGVDSHVYAPLGLTVRDRWRIEGESADAERPQGVPAEGLYLRDDTEIRCSLLLANFVTASHRGSHESIIQNIFDWARKDQKQKD